MRDPDEEAWIARQREYWDRAATAYSGMYRDSWSRLEDEQLRKDLQWVRSLTRPRVLELGCGAGLGYEICQALNPSLDYTGLDASSRMLDLFRAKWPDIRVFQDTLPSPAMAGQQGFDVVLAINASFSYLYQPVTRLHDVYKLTNSEGQVALSVLGRGSLRRMVNRRLAATEEFGTRQLADPGRRALASTVSISELARAAADVGFRDVKVQGRGVLAGVAELPSLWVLGRLLDRLVPGLGHTLWLRATR